MEAGNDNEINSPVELTDHQLARLEALPFCDNEMKIDIGGKPCGYSKLNSRQFNTVNLTTYGKDSFPEGYLTFYYSKEKKTCGFLHGDVDQLDKFLADIVGVFN